MSDYVPTNLIVFCSAYAGAIDGMGISGRPITSPNETTYTINPAELALAYAEEFDTVWASATTPDTYQVLAILSASEGYFRGKSGLSAHPANYLQTVSAIIAVINEGESTLGAQGITPPGWGMSGAQGPQGAQGSQGSQGAQGNGSQGAQGAKGAQGSQGAQGAQGAQAGGSAAPLTLMAAAIGNEGSSTSVPPSFSDFVRITPCPFAVSAGKTLYMAVRANVSGTAEFDFYDNTNAVSLIGGVVSVVSASATFAIVSATLVNPMLIGGDYSLRAGNTGGGGGASAKMQSAWIE